MQLDVYRQMELIEDRHWWFTARRDIVLSLLERWGALGSGARIVDIGCGTGAFLRSLSGHRVDASGFDPSPEAVRICKARHLNVRWGGLPDRISSDEPADTVLLLDVLEHVADDRLALECLHSIVKPDGHLLLTVPAHPKLWSEHDERHHHHRRYTRKALLRLLRQAGWDVDFFSSYNSLLFPAAVSSRLLSRWRKAPVDTTTPSHRLNRSLHQVFRSERHLLGRGVRLPLGLSFIAWVRSSHGDGVSDVTTFDRSRSTCSPTFGVSAYTHFARCRFMPAGIKK